MSSLDPFYSNATLTLKQHWREGTPPLLNLLDEDDAVGTEQTESDLTTESGSILTDEGLALPWVPSLQQIKMHLRLELDDDEHNELLLVS